MNSYKFTSLLLLLCFNLFSQQKITVDEIFTGAFRAKGMDELQSMKNTNQYTVLNSNKENGSLQIDLYDFATLKKQTTLIDSQAYKDLPAIDGYTFDASEKMILLACNSKQIFRHSFTADYYLYNTTTKDLTKLFNTSVQEPAFSPDGQKIAYAKENNLYVYDIASKESVQITTDGKKNSIINGITDWVYEEEFAFVKAFDWSKDSKKIAYIRFDESDVPEFSMSVFQKNYTQQLIHLNIQKREKKFNSFIAHI